MYTESFYLRPIGHSSGRRKMTPQNNTETQEGTRNNEKDEYMVHYAGYTLHCIC